MSVAAGNEKVAGCLVDVDVAVTILEAKFFMAHLRALSGLTMDDSGGGQPQFQDMLHRSR